MVKTASRGVLLVLVATLLALATSALAPSGVRAQVERVLLLPTAGDDALHSERAAVQQALASLLMRTGASVVHARELQQGGREDVRCANADCAAALLREAGADIAVASAAWGASQAGTDAGRVVIVVVDAQGQRYPSESTTERGYAQAAEAAVLAARGLRLLGPGPWLEVSAPYAGARLWLDGELVGALPYRAAIETGRHEMRVEADGRAPWVSAIDVPLGSLRVFTVRVGDAASTGAVARSEPSAWNYVLGGALLVAGAVVLVDPIHTLAREGECVGERDAQERCSERVTLGARSAVQLAVGSALVLGGGLMLFTRPLQVRVSADASHAQAQLQLAF